MSIQKPLKPDVTLPDNFGGIKTPYSEAQIRDGYLQGVPEIVDGGNINYEKDALFQKVKYCEAIADVINGILPNNTIAVDSNNRFTYTTQVQMATDAEFQAGTSELKVPNVKQTKTESERIMAAMNNYVDKTSKQNISGVKTFIDNIQKNVDVIRGQIPATSSWNAINFIDNNGNWLAGFEYNLNTDKSSSLSIILSDSVSNTTNIKADIELHLLSDGTSYVTAPASDIYNSILTTVSINKSETGGTKLGNGNIINWGTLKSGKTITYKIPFTGSNTYALVFNNNSGTNGYGRGDIVTSKSSTSATVNNLCENPIRWLAIGY